MSAEALTEDERVDCGKRIVDVITEWWWAEGARLIAIDDPDCSGRITAVRRPDGQVWFTGYAASVPGDYLHEDGYVPDLLDPATRGCLRELVRACWSETLRMEPLQRGGWIVGMGYLFDDISVGPTRSEALVKALETAPRLPELKSA